MLLHLVGGFLGAGKTTAILAAWQELHSKGISAAVILNDQGNQQVDSKLMQSHRIPSEEIADGCFCCRFDQLVEKINSLVYSTKPEVLFAESVGSCTDLIATVAKPMIIQYPDLKIIISIFADATLLISLIEGTSLFIEENLRYIFKKQIEEADLLIINKSDQVTLVQRERISAVLGIENPGKKIIFQNSLDASHIMKWLKASDQYEVLRPRTSLIINYDLYADGEARLSWMDAAVEVSAPRYNAWSAACAIISSLNAQICALGFTIGHLKFLLEADGVTHKASYTMHQDEAPPGLPERPVNRCKLLINARVQTSPEQLTALLDEVLKEVTEKFDCAVKKGPMKAFRPGYPVPTHRIAD